MCRCTHLKYMMRAEHVITYSQWVYFCIDESQSASCGHEVSTVATHTADRPTKDPLPHAKSRTYVRHQRNPSTWDVDESNTMRVSVDHLSVSTRQLVETWRLCANRKIHEQSSTDPLPRRRPNNWYCQSDSKKLAFRWKVPSCNLSDRTQTDGSSFRSRSICRRPWPTTSCTR